jgi:hypothetical protein
MGGGLPPPAYPAKVAPPPRPALTSPRSPLEATDEFPRGPRAGRKSRMARVVDCRFKHFTTQINFSENSCGDGS